MRKAAKSGAARIGGLALLLGLVLGSALLGPSAPAVAQLEGRSVDQPSPVAGNVPGGHLGASSDSELWRMVRQGRRGRVSIPDQQAAIMIQSEGDIWRAWRNGPVTVGGLWALSVMVGLLALFFVVRGRIGIDAGPSGRTVERFNGLERIAHWLTAVSFIVLALTGLNLLYGKHVFLPVLGPEIFAAITSGGKYVHDFIAFAFMAGLVMIFVLWVRDNIPNRADWAWIIKGGGLFVKGVHPPSKKFNAGQKMIFWIVILGGLSLSLSGLALLLPFEFTMFAWTFKALNLLGLGFPGELTLMQEMQLQQLWHAAVGLAMIALILAHIYIGSLGMEGAFDAMNSGRVDENWAREHHSIWVAELKTGSKPGPDKVQPAE